MEQPDYAGFFAGYVMTFNDMLAGKVSPAQVRDSYAEAFISAGAGGKVQAGSNDESFARTLEEGLGFYRRIGYRALHLRAVQAHEIDAGHDLVRVSFRSDYQTARSRREVRLEFDVSYLLQRRPGGPKVFGFVAGDEMALYREHGLVDAQGRPVEE